VSVVVQLNSVSGPQLMKFTLVMQSLKKILYLKLVVYLFTLSCYLIGLKMRGRPKGSKNKPKVPGAGTTAAAPKALVAPPPKFTDKDFDQLKTAEKKRTRYCRKKENISFPFSLSGNGSLPAVYY
jgi:hypothetical protein